MTLNYKRLGQFIELCNDKNSTSEIADSDLRGISNRKHFQKAKTNTIGVDLSKYRIVRKGQFAFNRATTRNGDRISIALQKEKDCIVSPSYRIFQSKDENVLDSEYLMMWFRRSEFDRYARFKSHGSAHEFFDFEEMCEIELPLPNITEQKKIVQQYKAVSNRIKLNKKINQKLEETAQTLYKHWFVDFEFPNEEGKPYSSSGGEMVYNEELDKEIPKGWEVKDLSDYLISNPDNISNSDNFENIQYLETSSITKNKIGELKQLNLLKDEIPSRAKRKVKHNDIIYSTVRPALCHYGILRNPPKNLIISTGFIVLRAKGESFSEIIYQFLVSEEITKFLHLKAEMSVSTYPSIKSEDILRLKIPLPSDKIIVGFEKINNKINYNNIQIQKLTELQKVLLSKMSKVEEEVA